MAGWLAAPLLPPPPPPPPMRPCARRAAVATVARQSPLPLPPPSALRRVSVLCECESGVCVESVSGTHYAGLLEHISVLYDTL